jgi:uroporphyrinogen-III synthase
MRNNPDILITAEINESLCKKITAEKLHADVIPFIQTKTIRTKKVQQKIKYVSTLNSTVIFTSSNAVEAVQEHLQNKKPAWKIFAVGNSTGSLVKEIFNEEAVIGVADNALALAEKIIPYKSSINEVYFFCGDKKRDELPALLTKNNIAVNEVEVYTTTILQHKIKKDYDGILFFSPSAVKGFFENNAVVKNTALFAIGNTTAEEIKMFSTNNIIVSDKPGKQDLINKVIEYFNARRL